jgi:hypothetical protein
MFKGGCKRNNSINIGKNGRNETVGLQERMEVARLNGEPNWLYPGSPPAGFRVRSGTWHLM